MITLPKGKPPFGRMINPKEETEMMMNNNHEMFMNIATLMAEDAGAPELRNPLAGSMQAKGWLSRLFGRKNRNH